MNTCKTVNTAYQASRSLGVERKSKGRWKVSPAPRPELNSFSLKKFPKGEKSLNQCAQHQKNHGWFDWAYGWLEFCATANSFCESEGMIDSRQLLYVSTALHM
jgi:uncharacterized cupin superfamily protein